MKRSNKDAAVVNEPLRLQPRDDLGQAKEPMRQDVRVYDEDR